MTLEDRVRARADELERRASGPAQRFAAAVLRQLLEEDDKFQQELGAALLQQQRERYGQCPECGELAQTVSVGVVLVERTKGQQHETSRPADAPPRAECGNGHWWIVTSKGPMLVGPPEEVHVLYEPR